MDDKKEQKKNLKIEQKKNKIIEQDVQNENVRTGEIRYKLDQGPRIRFGVFQFVSTLVIVVLLSFLTATFVSRRINQDSFVIDGNSDFSQVLRKSLDNFETSFYDSTKIREIYNDLSLSLVGVTNDPQFFYEENYESVYTGVVMNSQGYLLVPYDAVSDMNKEVYVRTDRDNDRIYQAEVIGRDATIGVALIRVENINLRAPKFSDSSTVKIAQKVIAMGNPFGNSDRGTVTLGMISTVNKAFQTTTYDERDVKIYAIETDAILNSGNNGGILVNMYGEVVGINSLRLTEGLNSGLGAAITSNEARNITRSFINTGEELMPFIGIFGDVITDLPDVGTGFYVQRIVPDGTADRAGLRPTDIILSVDGVFIETNTTLDEYIKTRKVGDVVKIKYQRVDEVIEVDATLYGTTVD